MSRYKLSIALGFIIFFLPVWLSAQDWSEPVNISTMNGGNQTPGFTIDNQGNLHCVWAHVVNYYYAIIYYSKSEDNGATWSTPVNISQNAEKRPIFANIVTDSQGKIYVTYDMSGSEIDSKILMKVFDGIEWSPADTVSGTTPYASHNKLFIDHNDRIYCFWNQTGTGADYCYRYLENNVWSEVFHPYTFGFFAFSEIIVDAANNLQCLGDMFEGNIFYVYIKYDYLANQWSDTLQISEKTTGDGDIDLDNNNFVHFTWRHKTPGTPNPMEEDSTLYRYFDGNSWTTPEVVTADPWGQQIQLINNKVYITDFEKNEGEEGNIVLYKKDFMGNWIGELVDSDAHRLNIFKKSANILHVLYESKPDENTDNIYYTQKIVDTITNSREDKVALQSMEIYPNPFSETANIEFRLLKESHVILRIHSGDGKIVKTIYDGNLTTGDIKMVWDGTNDSGEKVKNATYLVRLTAGKNQLARWVVMKD